MYIVLENVSRVMNEQFAMVVELFAFVADHSVMTMIVNLLVAADVVEKCATVV